MELKNKIYIYSDAIQTGKTTRVLAWVNGNQNVYGILTPDVAGKRRLYNIAEKQLLPFEAEKNTTEPSIIIGDFTFLKSAFTQAQKILENALFHQSEWLIIDEIGKLEMQNEGLEPRLSSILNDFSAQSPETKILFIIRDTLLEAAIKKYHLQNAEVIDYRYFFTKNNSST